jgi:hypothetical protein
MLQTSTIAALAPLGFVVFFVAMWVGRRVCLWQDEQELESNDLAMTGTRRNDGRVALTHRLGGC